jgi:hypothetical protein
LTGWPDEQMKISKWAEENKISILSTEPILSGSGVKTSKQAQALELMQPEEVIRMFGSTEKLSEDIISMGIQLVKSV